MRFSYAEGATPYNQDDSAALIPKHITTQKQLNEWEQSNIIKAERWLFSSRKSSILEIGFIKKVHKKMFDQTWLWAGQFRTHNTNIGVDFPAIQEALLVLCGDAEYWIKNNTFPIDEIATRFHCRIASVHPFSNGNGRNARLITDAFLVQNDRARFTWGRKNLSEASKTRKNYIHSLRAADKGDIQQLIDFARS